MTAGYSLRPLDPADSIPGLTALLHRGYAALAAEGFRFLASYQDAATTRRRVAAGECWVAVAGQEIAGTITYVPPGTAAGCAWYERPDVATFGQLTVAPELRGQGVGGALLDLVERLARRNGAEEIACDTAAGAARLVAMYERRGYRVVERADWRPVTNYESVVLSKALTVGAGPGRAASLPAPPP